MKTFKKWIRDELGLDLTDQKSLGGNWFAEHGIPMVVSCTCCHDTLNVASAVIDEDKKCFCHGCGEELDTIEKLEGED